MYIIRGGIGRKNNNIEVSNTFPDIDVYAFLSSPIMGGTLLVYEPKFKESHHLSSEGLDNHYNAGD
jgi:hypothetical protein